MPTISLAPWQFKSIENPFQHFCMYGGVATGKTYTGSHFAIKMIREYPELTGFIAANYYDQLSQATLREFFYWLDFYGLEYVSDCIPPKEWGYEKKKLKEYKNTIHVRNPKTGKVTLIFTRILTKADKLRGIEISWYWIDEGRDTKRYAHDMILGRMRESNIMKGLMTTTTNGEGWDYERFVLGNKGDMIYGSIHVATIESVKAGLITFDYYNTLLASYSPLMAEQELNAQHVNVFGGKAYHSAGPYNRASVAPWGDRHPTRDRRLIVGCDFNYAPAPCVWIVGQTGPVGSKWEEHMHWFGEVAYAQVSTPQMTRYLMNAYPDFFYEIYGDASGNRGSTSNAGESDYNQMGQVLAENGCLYSINVDQSNPRVKDRIENMCMLLRNAVGETRMTYNPETCPLFDGDMKIVGWKQNTGKEGKLDSMGDPLRTHSSDGAGYAMMKVFPPGVTHELLTSVSSPHRAELGRI